MQYLGLSEVRTLKMNQNRSFHTVPLKKGKFFIFKPILYISQLSGFYPR